MAVSPSSPQPATWLKLSSLLPVPLYTLAFIASFYLLSHLLFPHYFRRPKARAAILSFICSPTVTLLSLPFVQDFVRSGGDVGLLTRERETDAAFDLRREKLGEMICCIFLAFCIADLVCGSRWYPSRVNLLTGWIHHIVYAIIMLAALAWAQTAPFAVAAVLELPTFVLATGNISDGKLRNDYIFAILFFITRIVFHIFLCISYAKYLPQTTSTGATAQAVAAFLLLTLAFGLCDLSPFSSPPLSSVYLRRLHRLIGCPFSSFPSPLFALPSAYSRHVHWFKNNIKGIWSRTSTSPHFDR